MMIIYEKAPIVSNANYVRNSYAATDILLKAEFDERWIQPYHD